MSLGKTINLINYFSHLILFDEHRKIRKEVIKLNGAKNNFYDYGQSFFYQSMPCINLRGLRDTESRIKKLELEKYTYNKSILDIGTNVGGILLNIKNDFKKALGIEHNPKLIEIANLISEYLKFNNIQFLSEDFNTYNFSENFDVVLSLANHRTYDKGITDTENYFKKIDNIISKDGILFLESHPSLYEKKEDFESLVKNLENKYTIIKKDSYDFGNIFDSSRRYCVLKKK
tara:strand:- start:537 stop:1229 length:693 start_codon:yes stop_codon:yes gene_type:complete